MKCKKSLKFLTMKFVNWLKNIKHKRGWKKYLNAQKYWDDYGNISASEREALDSYNNDRWARREKRIDRLLKILAIIISFGIFLIALYKC